jgi:hypothetical protein
VKLEVVGLYVALAVYVWIDFMRLPPDGLANLGLMIVTLPVTIVGLLLTWATGRTGSCCSQTGSLLCEPRGVLLAECPSHCGRPLLD